MERLPEELVLMVLDRLSFYDLLACANVSRSWREAVAFHTMHVRKRSHELRIQRRQRALVVSARGVCPADLIARTPNLRDLTIHARVPLSLIDFKALETLKHLRHLDVFAAGRVLSTFVLPVALRLSSFVVNDILGQNVLRCLADATQLKSLHMYGHSQFYLPGTTLVPAVPLLSPFLDNDILPLDVRRLQDRAMTINSLLSSRPSASAKHQHAGELPEFMSGRQLHLTDLTLRCNELPDSAYLVFEDCRALVSLRLYACWLMTSEGASAVTRLRLRTLHVTGARMMWPVALHEFIAGLSPHLEELVLSAGWFGDEHVATLGARTPRLKVLELWRCHVTPAGLLALVTALPLLQELDVDINLDAEDVQALARLGRPQRLYCRLKIGTSADCAGEGPMVVSTQRAGVAISRGAQRQQAEGWRAGLYYSWSAAPRPRRGGGPKPPIDSLYDDSEDDYSLFGTDDESP